MQAVRVFVRSPVRQWRKFSLGSSIYNQQTDPQITKIDAVSIPPPSTVDKPLAPKIEKLITEISQLSLIEVSELTSGLKKRLNLPDAPMMPAGFAAAGSVPAEEEEAAPQTVKSSFTVKLMKFDDKQKVAIIKEVKALVEGMNLVQAKKFVEGAPAVVKADVSKEEAEKLKEALTKVGGTVEID